MPEQMMSQVGVRQLVPLLMVQSMDASLEYYVKGLGFTMTNHWTPDGKIRWCDLRRSAQPAYVSR